ncbi:AfsR/SARP family transcriptional regulator [Nonomuraea phyllanthi]|uniref:BTAD domain-containing putative transcriptional regulator n=1 Tax=Nonomuraea phyllanthi TaxID=2219224 RepID=UPI0012933CAA|nr:BTAD domain-containing putative transcriptional regulator [Nonomuraea phyllanthi]QFY13106.1 AfsR/SARP family transcriptional regulator [Nonomuraea phyllanthi]
MRFAILGETRAWREDGSGVALGGPARRALLALLLVQPGEVVPADRLAEELDPDRALSAHALQSQVSRLRTALGPLIERSGAGYRILVEPDDVDACRFERLAREGRAALRDGDARRAVTLLGEALELWQGPALADLAGSRTVQAAAVRLEERRLEAIEDRVEAELRLGEHRGVVPGLRELVGRHPLRERPAGLLMRALFAGGGQAEALVVFEETRRRLADELGADPSAELVALHRELLRADPSPPVAAPPAQLTSFVGRTDEVAEVAGLLRTARLVTLAGPGGVGKTRLSVEIAAGTDGEVCFVELAALRDGGDLPQALLGALGLRENGLQMGTGGQRAVDRLIGALSDRVLLLVLDNCEHVVEEAATLAARLLATCPRLRVLATSREPLGIIGEHIHQVRPLDGDAAVRLFTDRARAARRGFTADPEVVRRICAALDDLPLAIELAAARLRTLDIDDLAGRLDDRLGVAARGSRTADERHRTLRSVVAWSWDLLPEQEQRAARRFTVFAGGATAESALRVCGTAGETLESLVDKSLLELAGGRYRMLETIRAYAAERLDEAGERESASRAHARHLLELVRTADPHLRRTEQLEWLAVLAAEHANLLAAVRRSVEAREVGTALELLAAASAYLWIKGASASVAPQAIALLDAIGDAAHGPLDDGTGGAAGGAVGGPLDDGTRRAKGGPGGGPYPDGLGEEYAACVLLAASGPDGGAAWRRHRAAAGRALAAAWPGDRPGRYPMALLVWLMRNAGEPDPYEAFALVSAQRDCPEPWVRAAVQYVLGFAPPAPADEGGVAAAERDFAASVEGFRALGDRWGTALALDTLAGLAGARGDRKAAIALTDEALALTERLGSLEDSSDLLVNRGDHLVGDDPAAARADYERAARLARRAGGATYLAAALRGLADIALLERDLAEAERLYGEALERLDPHWVKSVGTRVRTLAGLGRVAEERGDHATALARYREAAAVTSPDVLPILGLPERVMRAVSGR